MDSATPTLAHRKEDNAPTPLPHHLNLESGDPRGRQVSEPTALNLAHEMPSRASETPAQGRAHQTRPAGGLTLEQEQRPPVGRAEPSLTS